MRLVWVALAALVLAGCVEEGGDAGEDDVQTAAAEAGMAEAASEAAATASANATPFVAEGTLWLPPSSGQEREESLLPFPVNATGMAIRVHVTLGSTYGPVELPVTMANVLVEVRDAAGEVLADGRVGTEGRELELEAEAGEAGEYVVALLSYGGSDGSSTGDHVHWGIETALS